MRAMMGGSVPRNRPATVSGVGCRVSGVSRTSHVSSFAPGNEPPPTSDSPSMSSAAPPTPLRNASPRRRISATSSVSIRSTGIFSRACSGSLYRASVASRAASVNLSDRTARARGSWRHAAIAALVPSRIPACGPPSSLSPENATASTPLPSASRTVGSPASPQGERSRRRPLPRS